MFWIQTHIAVADVAVSSRDMRLLVINGGFLTGNQHRDDEMEQEDATKNQIRVFFQEIHSCCGLVECFWQEFF